MSRAAAGCFATALVVIGIMAFPAPALAHGGNNDPNVIHACVQQSSNQVRIVVVTGSCTNAEAAVHWSIAGAEGQAGPAGPAGADGAAGQDGADGADGTDGAPGAQGPQGTAGRDAPAAEYGVAAVTVQRGTGAPAIWATYSTRLGSPVGDTTGGAFRFTCATAPCKVSVSAAVLANGGYGGVYPRVLIQRQDFATAGLPTNSTSAPQKYCEYGDGSFTTATPNGVASVASQPSTATPTYTPIQIHIGGSADCGGPDPTASAVSQITVPVGYYDVFSTFIFVKP